MSLRKNINQHLWTKYLILEVEMYIYRENVKYDF